MLPLIALWKVSRARKRYEAKCRYIDTLLELPIEERACSKEMARAILLEVIAKFAANK